MSLSNTPCREAGPTGSASQKSVASDLEAKDMGSDFGLGFRVWGSGSSFGFGAQVSGLV